MVDTTMGTRKNRFVQGKKFENIRGLTETGCIKRDRRVILYYIRSLLPRQKQNLLDGVDYPRLVYCTHQGRVARTVRMV